MTLTRISAGRYRIGRRLIIRTHWEKEGPRGGSRTLWELGGG